MFHFLSVKEDIKSYLNESFEMTELNYATFLAHSRHSVSFIIGNSVIISISVMDN